MDVQPYAVVVAKTDAAYPPTDERHLAINTVTFRDEVEAYAYFYRLATDASVVSASLVDPADDEIASFPEVV